MTRPLLLVDVDGVISLFGFDPAHPPDGKFEIVDGIAHFLSDEAARGLRLLCQWFEPVWCTGWEEKANDYLPLALGLPVRFPFLTFSDGAGPGTSTAGHWKLDAIDAYAGPDWPLAWTARGLAGEHVRELERWAAARRP